MPARNNPPTQASQDRVIRVFISSTFRDMMRERDVLVKEVFPELRRKCAKRFVTFTEVDLRWGITEAEANEGQVLPLCLAEIERSRPHFIGLLGERYGWIPDTIRPEVIEREPWLKEHMQGRTSVTELEILHGVLNNPKMESHAFFYFRDPAYADDPALTDDERGDMVERDIRADVEKYGPAAATRLTEERKAKLAALKQRIRESKLPVAEPYRNPKTLARLVRRQFNRLIDRLYPEEQVPDPFAQERLAHEAHAKNKLFACIERPAHLAAINAFAAAEHDGKGLVITGESGGGKTALLAAWARDWRKNHPADFLFQHYFGATPDSASPEGFLRRLVGELKSRFGITDDIPTDPEKLREALPSWLAQASAKVSSPAPTGGQGVESPSKGPSRIILVLDGLNQVQGTEPDLRLRFLPRHFPPRVVVLASALAGQALEALRERGWTEHDLPRASKAEVDAMVGEYLRIHARALEPELRHELVTARGSKNPLFLRTVLEELRQFGSFERLPQRVRHYLEADNPKDLFLRVLTRWQEDFDGKDPEQDKSKLNLVRRALTHLWAARQGLSEAEWLDLLGDGSQPLPRALWTPLFLALEPHLSQRAGLLAFGHDFLRQAVEAAFVSSDSFRQTAHLSVADYFARQPTCPRRTDELPWQLREARSFEALYMCLCDLTFLAEIWERDSLIARQYWASVESKSQFRMTDAYQDVINTPEFNTISNLRILGFLLGDTGHLREALHLRAFLSKHYQANGPLLDYANHLGDQAVILKELAEYDKALGLMREQEAIYRSLGDELGVSRSIGNQATVLLNRGRYDEAASLLAEKTITCARLGDRVGLARSMGNQALILRRRGEFQRALELHQAEERIFKELGDVAGVSVSIGNQGTVFQQLGNLHDAMKCYKEQERICADLGDNIGLSRSIGNQALILHELGDNKEAMRLAKEQARLSHESGNRMELSISLDTQAILLADKGDLEGAMKLHGESEQMCRESGNQAGLAACLGNQASILKGQGKHEDAFRKLRDVERMFREMGDPNLARALANLAIMAAGRGDLHAAVAYAEEAHSIAAAKGMTAEATQYSSLLSDFRKARAVYRQSIKPREDHKEQRPAASDTADQFDRLRQAAAALNQAGDSLGALERLREQEEYARKLGERRLAQNLADQGVQQMRLKMFDDAMPLLRSASDICLKHNDWKAAANCLLNVAGCCYEKGRAVENSRGPLAAHDDAMQAWNLAEEAYKIASDHGLADMVHHLDSFRVFLKQRLRGR